MRERGDFDRGRDGDDDMERASIRRRRQCHRSGWFQSPRGSPGAEEEKNDPEMARKLAGLAEIYVNDAFGSAHRAHASTEGVARFLPGVAGFLIVLMFSFYRR